MYVQVIKGRAADAGKLADQMQRWRAEVRPGATGFLGSTAGVTDDGTCWVLARFEDEAAAEANSARAEQSAWWDATSALFDGEPTFRNSSDIATVLGGGSNDAGFVQVMEGRADRSKVEAIETPEMIEQLRAVRPDLLGVFRAWFDGGEFVEAAYFTSEEAARSGESSSEFSEPNQAFADAYDDITFHDLRNPMLD